MVTETTARSSISIILRALGLLIRLHAYVGDSWKEEAILLLMFGCKLADVALACVANFNLLTYTVLG